MDAIFSSCVHVHGDGHVQKVMKKHWIWGASYISLYNICLNLLFCYTAKKYIVFSLLLNWKYIFTLTTTRFDIDFILILALLFILPDLF